MPQPWVSYAHIEPDSHLKTRAVFASFANARWCSSDGDVMDVTEIERRTAETLERLLDLVEARDQRSVRNQSDGSVKEKTRPLRGEARASSLHWKDLALCNGDADFNPFDIPKASVKVQREAKRYEIETCRVCEVKVKCLEDGPKDDLSIRGGLLPKERRPRRVKREPEI